MRIFKSTSRIADVCVIAGCPRSSLYRSLAFPKGNRFLLLLVFTQAKVNSSNASSLLCSFFETSR